jgi:dolichol-phosphate mannosyltransferase
LSSKLLVFIPCYNCEAQIPRVLAQFNTPLANWFSEILILDNGSKDNTIGVAIEAASAVFHRVPGLTITIGKNLANYNLGGSHKAAFQYAAQNDFSHVVVLHGDDQGSIHDLGKILENGEHESFDACLGARFMAGSSLRGYSLFRIVGNYVFNVLFSIGAGRSVRDLGSGLNIFGSRIIRNPAVQKYADDLRFNIYLLLGVFNDRLNARYFPISWREEDQVSNVRMMSQAVATLKLLWQSIVRKKEFWDADHREIKHTAYRFEAIRQFKSISPKMPTVT